MIYCHECGSEVAETSEFCPYCGIILLKPQADPEVDDAPAESAEIELDHTIVMSASDAAEVIAPEPPNASPEKTENNEPASLEQAEPAPAEQPEGGIADDEFDIPTPQVISELEERLSRPTEVGEPSDTSDTEPKPTLEVASEPEPEVVGEKEPEIASTSEAESEPAPEMVSEPSSATASEPMREVSEPEAASEPEAEIAAEPTPEPESEPEVVSEPAPKAEAQEPIAEVASEIRDDAAEFASDSPTISGEPLPAEGSDEAVERAEPAELAEAAAPEKLEEAFEISKPDIELPEEEKFHDSMFDSVRIVSSEEYKPENEQSRTVEPAASEKIQEETSPESEPTPAEPTEPSGTSHMESGSDSKKAAKLKPLAEGVILMNRYEIIRKIGGGGMGAVYLASDNNLGGVLRAVKEMVQAHIEEEQQEKAIEDFKRESMILSSLDHVSIPTIFDYFYDEHESRFYLVMKYISGGDLSTRLRSAPEGKIDEKTVTEWAIQIIDVLDYLHSQPSVIVYRDLKPSNIMLDGNSGRVMLIDFGIARSINQKDEKGVTAVGTMGYAPPELFSGKVEPRSDIYSLGSTMFHLLTGADPQSNPLLIFDFQKNPRPRQINPQLSDQMETILMRAVEYNADARFPSAADMRSVLEEHSKNLAAGRVTYGVSEAPEAISLANQTVFCGFCGQNIVATDLFCAFCGAKQPIAQHGVHSEIYSRESARTARLVIVGTDDLQSTGFTLAKNENLVGRRDPMSNIFPEIDLSKFDPQTKISRRHAKIWHDGTKYFVEDLGSSNGTLLAENSGKSFRLSPHSPHILTSGDVIRVGDTNLQFLVG